MIDQSKRTGRRLLAALAVVALAAAAPGPAAAVADTETAAVLLVFGDSIADGYGLERAQAFPALVQQRIAARGWPVKVVNAGLSGETSAAGRRRIGWLLRRPYDYVLLELGANDGLRGLPLAETRKNLQAIVDRVKEKNPAVRFVIAGMRIPPNLGAQYADEFAAIFPRLAADNDAALIPFLLEHVGGHPDLNLADGKHPNVEGHRIIAETVWPILERHLRDLSDSSP